MQQCRYYFTDSKLHIHPAWGRFFCFLFLLCFVTEPLLAKPKRNRGGQQSQLRGGMGADSSLAGFGASEGSKILLSDYLKTGKVDLTADISEEELERLTDPNNGVEIVTQPAQSSRFSNGNAPKPNGMAARPNGSAKGQQPIQSNPSSSKGANKAAIQPHPARYTESLGPPTPPKVRGKMYQLPDAVLEARNHKSPIPELNGIVVSGDDDFSNDDRLQVSRLSPAFNALVLAMLRLLGDDPFPENHSENSGQHLRPAQDLKTRQLREEMTDFFLTMELIKRLYEDDSRKELTPSGPEHRIASITEFFNLTEPITPITSTAREAIKLLTEHAYRAEQSPEEYKPVPVIKMNRDNFISRADLDSVAMVMRDRRKHAHDLLIQTGVQASSDLPETARIAPRIINRFFAAVLGAALKPREVSKGLRASGNILIDAEGRRLVYQEPVKGGMVPANIYYAGVLNQTADALDVFDSVGVDEEWVLNIVNQILDITDPEDKVTFIQAVRDGLNGVVREICDTLGELQKSPSLSFMQENKDLAFFLEVLKKYPEILPRWALQDIVYSIFLQRMDFDPFKFVRLVLAHSGPILKSFVQRLADESKLRQGSSVFYEICKALQSANLPMTIEEVWKIIQKDPRKYDIVYLDPREPKVGKLAQVHRAILADGQEVAIRVPKPSAIDLLEPEHLGFTRELVKILASQFFPDDPPEVGQSKAVRELSRLFVLLKKETLTEETIENIQLAGETYNTDYKNVITPGGKSIDISFHVPNHIAAKNEASLTEEDKKNTKIIVTKWVNQVSVEKLKKEGHAHTLQAVGTQLYHMYYQRSFLDLAQGKIPGNRALVHVDPHMGNLMFTRPIQNEKTGRELETVYLTDVGLGLRITPEQARAIIMFNAGATIRHPWMTAAGLWEMRDPNQDSFVKNEKELLAMIQKVQERLRERGSTMSAAEYVLGLWTDGYMNFPNEFLGLHLGIRHLDKTVEALEAPPERIKEVEKAIVREGSSLVEGMVQKRWPIFSRSFLSNTSILVRARARSISEKRRVCQLELLHLKNERMRFNQ